MNVLYINCCSGMRLVVLKGEEVFLSEVDKREHTDSLLFEVDALLGKAELDIADIDAFGVCLGPGSFTGIRVAVATVKGLADSSSKIFAFGAFDALSFLEKGRAFYLLEGFSDNLFYRYFDGFAHVERCEKYLDFIERYRAIGEDVPIFVNSEKLQNLLKMNEIPYQNAQNHEIELIKSKIEAKDFIGLDELVPIYLRLSQAELERKKTRLEQVLSKAQIGELESYDAASLFELESELFKNADRAKIEAAIASPTHKFFVLRFEQKVIGFVECQVLAPEAEIFEIGVDPSFQDIGLSKRLLEYAKSGLKALGCNTIFLEVNKINHRAICLYLSSGFCSYSERKNYYGDNDAILMKANI